MTSCDSYFRLKVYATTYALRQAHLRGCIGKIRPKRTALRCSLLSGSFCSGGLIQSDGMLYPASWPCLALSIDWALLLAGNPVPDSEELILLEVLCPKVGLAMLPGCALFLSGEPVAESVAAISAECPGLLDSSISVSDMSAASIRSAPSCGASSSASLGIQSQ